MGLYYGSEKGNLEALKAILERQPQKIVFLGLIPTKGTPMENSATIAPEFVARVLLWTRLTNPGVEQILGCMRVRDKELEQLALKAGINRIAVPKKETVVLAQKKYQLLFQKKVTCCAIL